MKSVKRLTRDIREFLDTADLEVLHDPGQPGRGNTKQYAERVLALTLKKGLDPETYFESLVLDAAAAHIEARSKKSPLQSTLIFEPADLDFDSSRQAIIRLGDGNFVSWAMATLDDLQVHQDTQLRQGLAIQQRSVITQSLIQSFIWEASDRSRKATVLEAMNANGFWLRDQK